MEKLQRLCGGALGVLLMVSMGWVFCLLAGQATPLEWGVFGAFCGLVLAAAHWRQALEKALTPARCRRCMLVLLVVMVAGQMALALLRPKEMVPDYRAVYLGAQQISAYGGITAEGNYYRMYPHQLFTAFCYGVMNRVFVLLGAPGPVSLTLSALANCLLTGLGTLLVYESVKRLLGCRAALLAFVLLFCNVSLWTQNVCLYPHSFSFIFLAAVLFCGSAALGGKKRPALWCLALGAALSLASRAEGILLIGLPAMVIALVVRGGVKPLARSLTALLLGFAAAAALVQGVYSGLQILDTANMENERFPLTHWIMMGLSEDGYAGPGTFSHQDFGVMMRLPTAQEKAEYSREQIALRLEKHTPASLARHLAGKTLRVWRGGGYGSTLFSEETDAGLVRGWRLCMVLAAGLLGLRLIRACRPGHRGAAAWQLWIGAWIMGIFFFVWLWESNMDYLHSSQAVLVMAAVLGLVPWPEPPEKKQQKAERMHSDD